MRTRSIMIALLLLVAAACGSDEAASPSGSTTPEGPDLSEAEFVDETASTEVEVDAIDNSFKPEYVEVKAGTAVTFRNDGRNDHNVLPVVEGAFEEVPADEFDPGAEATITFDEVGDVPYYCSLHGTKTKGMVGAVRVVE
jgi:plastocyanin